MITITRRFTFCAGHRLKGHEGKCVNPHGHNYVAVVHVAGDPDTLGRVVDFSVLKERVGSWIDEHWDHAFIYERSDSAVASALAAFQAIEGDALPEPTTIGPVRSFVMDGAPTAENMAAHLLGVCRHLLVDTSVRVVRIELWETENCKAEVSA